MLWTDGEVLVMTMCD